MRQTLVQYLRRRPPLIPARTAFGWAHVEHVEDVARAHLPPVVPPWVLKLLAAVMVLGERLLPVPDAYAAEGLRETLAHELRLLGGQEAGG